MTDEWIMEAVKSGELQQASLLFDRYNKRIFNFLARMTMDRDLAEDLTGKGHITRVIGNEDRITLAIPVSDK